MIIEIKQAGFVNKGSELMLHAVVQKIRQKYPDAKLTMSPIYGGSDDTFEKMRDLNIYPKAWLWVKGVDFGQIAEYLPAKQLIFKKFGLVFNSEVDVVIDAAGFSYSDQWGYSSSKELASSSTIWKKNGTKLILLPQAMGPFKTKKIQKYVKKWAENADLIFPREEDSYNFLTNLVGEHNKIKQYPDFTNLVEGTLPEGYIADDKKVALIPNYRMIDKTEENISKAYLPFMIHCAKYLVDTGRQPFILVHESENDNSLALQISNAVGGIPIIQETNPLHIKGIIGTCDATIGSRFHGLVSSLSQGIPSLATGWSHKYLRLFQDYDFPDGIVDVNASKSEIEGKIDLITQPKTAFAIRDTLNTKSKELKLLSENMWDIVFTEIDDTK